MTTLTKPQRDLIFGSLLGDGSLLTETQGRTWRYRAIQASEFQPYLFHKYNILQNLCGTPPKESNTYDPRTQKTYFRWSFNTLIEPSLKFYGDMFYRFNPTTQKFEKDVPFHIDKFLTPEALAYLYMDDGAIKWLGHSNAMRICTENFTIDGTIRIKKALLNLYGIKTNLSKKKTQEGERKRIEIPESSSATFCELIKPHLVDCMKYKVSDGKRGHL